MLSCAVLEHVNEEIGELLIQYGADLNTKLPTGDLPDELFDYFKEKGRKEDTDI